MDRNVQKIGLINLVLFLVLGAAALAVARYGQSLAGQTAAIFIGLGFLVAAVSWFQMRLEEQERLEKFEYEELSRSAASGTLFKKTPDAETFPVQQSREQFERFLVPAFTALLCALQGAGAWWSWWTLNRAAATHSVQNPLLVFGAFVFVFLVAFLLGKYSATVARLERVRLLRPSAGYLLLTAYLSLVVAGGAAAVWAGSPNVDYYVARVLSVLLGVVAVETLTNLVFELYRPRIKGKVRRPLYESRLVGLVGTPEGLITTAAQALDYQFGFKVSETWFYKFLEQRLAWLFLLQLIVLLLSTCVVFIEPGEEGLLERFGTPVLDRPVLGAGPHFKWPWPADKVYRFRTREVQSLNLGFEPDPAKEKERTVLWTVPHYKEEYNLLVASGDTLTIATNQSGQRIAPVNLLTVGIPLQYEITNVVAWAYEHEDAGKLLGQIGLREVVRYLASVDLFEVMSGGQLAGANELRRRIQARANELNLGVNILYLGLHDIHPPTTVAGSFQNVVSAQQDVQTNILHAQGLAMRTTLLAQAEAKVRVNAAEADAVRRVAGSAATAAQFTNQVAAYSASPEVYRMWKYLQTLRQAGANARKYIITSTNAAVLQLNLEDKIRTDLQEGLVVPPSK